MGWTLSVFWVCLDACEHFPVLPCQHVFCHPVSSASASETSIFQLAKGLVLLTSDSTSSLQELEIRKGQGITMPSMQAPSILGAHRRG